MALFRDRRGFPRWSFIDSRSLPRPRRAQDDRSAPSPWTPAPDPDVETEEVSDQGLVEDLIRESVAATPWDPQAPWSPDGSGPDDDWDDEDDDEYGDDSPSSPAAHDDPTGTEDVAAHGSWLDERRAWFLRGDWPTEPTDDAVEAARQHPERPYEPRPHPGLPADPPALVRAQHGRGFSMRHHRRRRRPHHHEPEARRTDVDLAALVEAVDELVVGVGDAMIDLVVWHTASGLALSHRGGVPESAPLWHGATRDLVQTLPHADLSAPGTYHLVGLGYNRLAVLVDTAALGACLTVDLQSVDLDRLLSGSVPALHDALVASTKEL